jgi:membrane protein
VSFALILIGPRLAEYIAYWTFLGPAFEWTWKILQWPLVFVLTSTGIAIVHYYAPDAEQDWVWLTPGSAFATTLWLLASLGFKYYVANMGHCASPYGKAPGEKVPGQKRKIGPCRTPRAPRSGPTGILPIRS